MLTPWHLPPPLTSTVKLSLFTHVHSSPLSFTARLHRCRANHSCYTNDGWTFSGQTSYLQTDWTLGLTDYCFFPKPMQLDAFLPEMLFWRVMQTLSQHEKVFFMWFSQCSPGQYEIYRDAVQPRVILRPLLVEEPAKGQWVSLGRAWPSLHPIHWAGFSDIFPKSLSSAYLHNEENFMKLYFM